MKNRSSIISAQLALLIAFMLIFLTYTNSYKIVDRNINYTINKSSTNRVNVTEILTYAFTEEDLANILSNQRSNMKNKVSEEIVINKNIFSRTPFNDQEMRKYFPVTIQKSFLDDAESSFDNLDITPINENNKEFKVLKINNNKGYLKLNSNEGILNDKTNKNNKNNMISLNEYSIEILPVDIVEYWDKDNKDVKNKDNKNRVENNKKKEMLNFRVQFKYNISYNSDNLIVLSKLSNQDTSTGVNNAFDNLNHENHLIRNIYNMTLPISSFDDALEIEKKAEITINFVGFRDGVKLKEEKYNENDIKNIIKIGKGLETMNFNSNKIVSNLIDYNLEKDWNKNLKTHKFKLALENNKNKNVNLHFFEDLTKDQISIKKIPTQRVLLEKSNKNDNSNNKVINKSNKVDSTLKASTTIAKHNNINAYVDVNNNLKNKNKDKESKVSTSLPVENKIVKAAEKKETKKDEDKKTLYIQPGKGASFTLDTFSKKKTPLEHIFAIIYLLLLLAMCVLCLCITTTTSSTEKEKQEAEVFEGLSGESQRV